MPISLQTEVRMVKGVGPQRAELLGKRGIYTLEDLLNYLPFRYEDRIHFSRIYNTLQNLDSSLPDVLPPELREKLHYPARREALIHTHFPPAEESLEALNLFRSPAQQRLIFEEFFLYQLSMALGRKAQRKENAITFRVREDKVREALKRILPFKPTGAHKRLLAAIAADLENPVPMN